VSIRENATASPITRPGLDLTVTSDQYTDEAIDRTLQRISDSEVEIQGDIAKLRIRWRADGGGWMFPAFLYCGSRPIATFRRVNDMWKIDAHYEIGFYHPADFFEPDSWFYFYPGEVALEKELIAEIEGNKLQTAALIIQALNAKWTALRTKVDEKSRSHMGRMQARFFAAWKISVRFTREYYMGRGSLWGICLWSRRLRDA
jgi:hypothetical protein